MNEKSKILVVTDEKNLAKELEEKLPDLGYSVFTNSSRGEDAIRETKKVNPHLVLMDIKRDEDIGEIETGRHIQSQYDIPIIYLISYNDKKTIERLNLSHTDEYLMKPSNLQEIHSNIQLALHKNKTEKEIKKHHQWVINTIQSLGNAVITTDMNKSITFMNSAAQKLTQIKREEIIGKPVDEIIHLFNSDTNQKISLFSGLISQHNKKFEPSILNDLILKTPNEKKVIVDCSISPLKSIDESLDGFVISFSDVSEKRESIKVLQKMSNELQRRVEKRTAELKEINSSLEQEIVERKKAEERAKEVQSSIENIINSTSEIIIALDSCNRVEYWNSSAQKLTGYKKKDVYGRYISKLPFVNDSKKLKDVINTVHESKEVISQKIVMITKDYSKRILNLSCAPMHNNGEKKGVVFVGKDITYDWESHHNLLVGHSYLIAEKNKRSGLDLFSNLIFSDFNGIYITRSHPKKLTENLSMDKIKPVFIRKNPLKGYQTISTKEDFLEKIKTYSKNKEKTVLFADGLHYFLTTSTFDEVLNTLYDINEIISDSSIMLLLYFDPQLFTSDELAFLQNEFEALPSKKVEDIKIKDELFDILMFIEKENKKNSLVSMKKIMSEFDIVYYTASKRVRLLVDEGLVFTKKYGKSRVVHLTEKTKTLLAHRETV